MRAYEVPQHIPMRGGWTDNGPLDDRWEGTATLSYGPVSSRRLNIVLGAAWIDSGRQEGRKALEAMAREAEKGHDRCAFRLALESPRKAGWKSMEIAAMHDILCMKFGPGTDERLWLTRQKLPLVSWNNRCESFYGVPVYGPGERSRGRNVRGLLLELMRQKIDNGSEPEQIGEEAWLEGQAGLIRAIGALGTGGARRNEP
jgi:hypothetical protein